MTFNRVFVNNRKVVIGGGGDYIKSIKQPDEFRNITTNINGMYFKYITGGNVFNINIDLDKFTFHFKINVDRLATWVDPLQLIFKSRYVLYRFRESGSSMRIIGSYNTGRRYIDYNPGRTLSVNTTYNYTLTKNYNTYKFYLDGELLHTMTESDIPLKINLNTGRYDAEYDNIHNDIFGDIFFADECLVDKNFTVDNTKLFMNELGPATTLESNNKLYGMK